MIIFEQPGIVNSIALTVTLLIYLIMSELGNEKLKKALMPFIGVLLAVFAIVAFLSIYATYTRIK
jgi:hypothetical protein